MFIYYQKLTHSMCQVSLVVEYRKDSFTFVQDKTINEMVQTNSHQFNTHVKRLSLSASVVIIIITASLQLVESSHNIPIIYCYTIFTTSPLKIDEALSTFQFCHSWHGTFGN